MYGTVARFRLKPGMEQRLRDYEQEVREARLLGLVAEFTYRMDADPNVYIEAIVFESKEAYFALANSPEQNARYQKLLQLLEGEPEWNDGEVVNTVGI